MDCSPADPSLHGDSPGKNTGVGCHALLQGIFPAQGLNPSLPHCRRILYQLSYQGSPKANLVSLGKKRRMQVTGYWDKPACLLTLWFWRQQPDWWCVSLLSWSNLSTHLRCCLSPLHAPGRHKVSAIWLLAKHSCTLWETSFPCILYALSCIK